MLTQLGRAARVPDDDPVAPFLDCHLRIRRFAALALDVGLGAGAWCSAAEVDVATAAARIARYFDLALPLHVADEERSLAPRLRLVAPSVSDALDAMEHEHASHDVLVRALVTAARRLAELPSSAERRGRLHEGAVHAAQALDAHLLLEESLIFPASRGLSLEQWAEVRAELAGRRAVAADVTW